MTLNVERIAHTGEGIAVHDGRTVLVRGGLPGEQVRAEIVHEGKITRANTVEVIQASVERVTPACAHVAKCGGCDLMHASPELQMRSRRAAVMEQLRSARPNVIEPTVHRAKSPLGYRSRVRLQVHCRGSDAQVGFYRPRSRRMAAVGECVVLRPALQPAIGKLRELVAGSAGSGEAFATLGANDGLCIDLRWEGRLDPQVFTRADAWVRDGAVLGIRLWEGKTHVPASFGDSRARISGAGGKALWIAPGGFAQASEEGGRLLAERVGELVAKRPGGLTIELFAGSGTLTVAAIPAAERYIAVEREPAAVRMLQENLRMHDQTAKVVVADADSYALRRPLATVILDPPRGGALVACKNIAAARPRQVVYVSCNPATLSRDLRELDNYRIEELELVELFPQTSHVETIVRLVRQS